MIQKMVLLILMSMILSCTQISKNTRNIAIKDIPNPLNITATYDFTVNTPSITSAANNFIVVTPKKGMLFPYHIENLFNGSRGGVSFHDDIGNLLAIYYMHTPDTNYEKIKIDASMLKKWFKEIGLPTYFLPLSKDTKIMQEKEITVGGEAAYFATIEIPNGSPIIMISEGRRIDTKRNILVLVRYGYVYLLSEERPNIRFKVESFKIGSNLDSSESSLIQFYETINFINI